jgi:polyisoprenoid-binding protein YceI
MLYSRLHIILIAIMMMLTGGTVFAQEVTIDKDQSRLWIEGRSNVNEFRCRAATYDTMVSPPAAEHDTLDVEVDIDVEGFDCGKRRMNRDLYETLLSDTHPKISFEYTGTEEISFDEDRNEYHLKVKGLLTVAGHTNEIKFPMQAEVLENGTMKATGQTQIRMTDFNVEPPRALLGMVRVDDLLSVHFELLVSINNLEQFYVEQDQE